MYIHHAEDHSHPVYLVMFVHCINHHRDDDNDVNDELQYPEK